MDGTQALKALEKLAEHLRNCVACGEDDVSVCTEGRPLWDAAMKGGGE